MKSFSLLTLLVLSSLFFVPFFVSAHGDHSHDHDHSHDDEPSEVVVLTKSTFTSQVEASPITLVEFFAPWCGHCKALAPNFKSAAAQLKGEVVLASVDCTTEKDLCSEYGVQGFPTLKIFRQSSENPGEYNGGRTADDIVKYMKKQNQPAYQVLTTEEEVTAFVEKEGVDVIGVFADIESDEAKAFLSVANSLRNDYSFGIVTEVDDIDHIIPTAANQQIYVLKSATDVATYSGEFESAAITSFINAEAFPLVGEIGPENFQKYLDRGLNLIWFFVDPKGDNAVLEAAETVAAEFKGRVSVVKLDGVRWAEHAKHFGLPAGQLPGIVAEDRTDQKNYVFSGEPTVEALRAHFQGFVDKTLVANVKSQEIPADNSAPVKVIVGKTFDEIVMDDSKDVFVEFYAPWCGHCKSLAPKYDELGARFEGNDKVVIAKIDATENDSPAKISGFPTLIFYKAGDKKNPVTYDGERTTDAMYEWIRSHGNTFTDSTSESSTADAESADHSDL